MVRPIFSGLATYAPKPALVSFYLNAVKTTALSVGLAAIGFMTGNRMAYMGAATAACIPFANWYKAPVFTMTREHRGEGPVEMLQNLYGDMIQCGLDGDNRAIAKGKFEVLALINDASFVDARFQRVDVSQRRNEIREVLNRTDERVTPATINFDLERLYFEVCSQNGVLNETQKEKYNSLRTFLTANETNPLFSPFIDRLNAIHAASTKDQSPPQNLLAVEARTLLLQLQKGTITLEAARAKHQEIVTLFRVHPDCPLKDELKQDLAKILALLMPKPQITTAPLVARAVPANAPECGPANSACAAPAAPHAAPVLQCAAPNAACAAPAGDCGPAPIAKVGLYRGGAREKTLQNICWLNAACQLIFRSKMIQYIERKVKEGNASTLLQLIYELKEAVVAKKPLKDIQDIQVKLVNEYKRLYPAFVIGEQHNNQAFMAQVVTDLGQLIPSTTKYTKPDIARIPALANQTTKANTTQLSAGYLPRSSGGFVEAMTKVPLVAHPVHKDSQGKDVTTTQRRELDAVPPFIVVRFMGMENRPVGESLPLRLDFSNYFNEDIRQKHRGKLYYRLAAANVHSNPGSSSGGHHTAQEQDGFTHYDDEYVRSLPVSAAHKNIVDAPAQVWELCEDVEPEQERKAGSAAGQS